MAPGSLNDKSRLLKEDDGADKARSDGRPGRGKPSGKRVGVLELFRFANSVDKLLIAVGFIAANITGAALPLNLLLVSFILDSLVAFQVSPTNDEAANELHHDVLRLAIYSVMLGVLCLVLGYLQMVCWATAARRQVRRIRSLCFRSITRQDIGWFDQNAVGLLNTKLTGDVGRIEGGMGHKMAIMQQSISQTICGYSLAILTNWKLTLIVFATLPAMMVLLAVSSRLTARLSRKEQTAYAEAGAVAEQALSSIKTVATFGGEEKEENRYCELLREAWRWANKKCLVASLGSGLVPLVAYSGLSVAYWFSTVYIVNGEITAGGVVLVVVAVVRGRQAMILASHCITFISNARASASSIYDLIDKDPGDDHDRGAVLTELTGGLVFDDVFFCYPSRPNTLVLRGVSLSIEAGKTVALVGASGCGKSTILQLLLRFYKPSSGKVLLDGTDITTLDAKWLRTVIGVVSQEPILFSTTVEENIRYGRDDATLEEVQEAAKQANAYDFIVQLPQGFETPVGQRGTHLSAGQKQRIAIARALLRNPRILLLDEATSALDNQSEAAVQAALDQARYGRTTVIVAHRLSTIRNADVIVAIKDGRIAEMGTHEELIAMEGVYNALASSQTLIDSDSDPQTPDSEEAEALTQPPEGRKRGVSVSSAGEPGDKVPDDASDSQTASKESPPPSVWRILKLNKPEWMYNLWGSFSAVIVGMMVPVTFQLVAQELSNFANPQSPRVMTVARSLSLVFFGLGCLLFLGEFFQNYFFGLSGESLTFRLRKKAFNCMLHQDISWFSEPANQVGALTTRLSTDAALVKGAAGERVGMLLQAVASIVAGLVASMVVEWSLTLIMMCFIPPMLVAGFVQGRSMRGVATFGRQSQEQAGKFAVDALSNIRTVVSLNLEAKFSEQYDSYFLHSTRSETLSVHRNGLMYGVSLSIRFFSFAVAYFYGSYLVTTGELEFQDVFFVYAVCVTGMQLYGNAKALSPDLSRSRLAAAKLMQLFESSPTVDSSSPEGLIPDKCKGEVELGKVFFRYPNRPECPVLRGMTLQAGVGQTVALVGSSGCGKSTTIQLLQRFYDPDQGFVTLDGQELQELNVAWLRRQIGLVAQEPVLFDISLRENIAYGDNTRDVPMVDIIEAAMEANIHHFIKALPQGYDTRVGDRGSQISAGQKQRVAIARALVRNPRVLLLDEATSALDTESEKVVQDALDKARVGRTCIMIAHRLSTIQNADLIVVIHNGKVVEQGVHSDLMAAQGYYHQLQTAGSEST